MMHILLMILKIIGIVLLAAVGLLLLAVLLALFCPVAYRGRFTRKAGNTTGSVSVTWLFRLVWVTAFYDNGDHGFRIRIFGIPLDAVSRLLAGRRGGKTEDLGDGQSSEKEQNAGDTEETLNPDKLLQKKAGTDRADAIGSSQAAENAERSDTAGDGEESSASGENAGGLSEKKPFFLLRIWRRTASFFRMLAGLPQRIRQAVRGFFQKISDILKKTGRFRELLCSEEFIRAFGLVRGSTGKLLRHVRPRKIRGYLTFGFEDPYHTGLCLGAVSVVYPWYHKTLTIEPDFRHKVLEADLYLRGRIFGVYALYILIRVYFDKNIKYMIRKFRDKEAR